MKVFVCGWSSSIFPTTSDSLPVLSSFSSSINAVQAYYNAAPPAYGGLPHEPAFAKDWQISSSQRVLVRASALVVQFLLGKVCSSFPHGCVDITKNGWFWSSAGSEYLPSGISGLAAAALPTADWDPFSTPVSLIR